MPDHCTGIASLGLAPLILNTFVAAYLEGAMFTDTGEEGQPPSDAEFSNRAIIDAYEDGARFLADHWQQIDLAIRYAGNRMGDYDTASVARDFWYTRNGQGTGFWDRGMGELGEALTRAAQGYPPRHLILTERGLIEFAG